VRTLVIHIGAIGDFLLTCPMLPGLRPVELLGRPERVGLAVAGGIADAAHDVDAVEFSSVFSEPSRRLRAFLAGYDRCIVWIRDDDGRIARNIAACGVPEVRAFPGLPPNDWTRHATEYYASCLGLDTPPPVRLDIAPSATAPDVIIHPGSGGRHKVWPIEHFAAVTDLLERRGLTVQWWTGPAEEDTVSPRPMRSGLLPELAAELSGARLYIGNDSGITHLAAAVGCSAIAIFGPTNPAVWAPRGDHVRVVQGKPWPEPREVADAAAGMLAQMQTALET
jgi:ADP-heptose:LPS heptosyltransferase